MRISLSFSKAMTGLMFLSGLLVGTGGAHAATFCEASSETEFQACRAGVNADYFTAGVTCQNLAVEARRIACAEAALQDRQDGIDDCVAQRTAEFSVCTQLGGVRYHPPIKPANFVAGVTNPFFPLVTGRTLVYEGTGPDGLEHDEVTPTGNTRVILGVTCTEVRDVVTLDGALVEDTLDWYAQDAAGNVWYFGEESKSYEAGRLVSLEGSWVAGRDGALPGIIMEAAPAVGDIYRQEFLAMEAEDVARVVATGRMVTVPAGTFDNCLVTRDFSPLEPGVVERKFYAPGVGVVEEVTVLGGSDRLKLVSIVGP